MNFISQHPEKWIIVPILSRIDAQIFNIVKEKKKEWPEDGKEKETGEEG